MKKIIKLDFKGAGAGMLQGVLKLSLGLFLFFSVTVLSAQSGKDFVGNRTLKSGMAAAEVLKSEYDVFSATPSSITSATDKKAVVMEDLFYPKAIDTMVGEGFSTKDALNTAANMLISKGYSDAQVTALINAILPKLS